MRHGYRTRVKGPIVDQFSGSESSGFGPAGIGSDPGGTLIGVTCTPGATIV